MSPGNYLVKLQRGNKTEASTELDAWTCQRLEKYDRPSTVFCFAWSRHVWRPLGMTFTGNRVGNHWSGLYSCEGQGGREPGGAAAEVSRIGCSGRLLTRDKSQQPPGSAKMLETSVEAVHFSGNSKAWLFWATLCSLVVKARCVCVCVLVCPCVCLCVLVCACACLCACVCVLVCVCLCVCACVCVCFC